MLEVKDIAEMVSPALKTIIDCEVEKAKEQAVKDYFSDSMTNIIGKMNEDFPEVVKSLANGKAEITEDDVPEEIKSKIIDDYLDDNREDIARDWAADNPEDAYDIAIHNMASFDLKERIKDAIDNL